MLIRSCHTNDIVYIHFSGHGQRVTDLDGDENDGWDESWIPYDAYKNYNPKDKGDKHLIDDEVYLFLNILKNKIGRDGKILVVVDACHGGDSSCGIEMNKNSNVLTVRGASSPFIIPNTKSYVLHNKKERWLTLSACKSFQINQELAIPRVGILSYALFSASKNKTIEIEWIERFIRDNKGPLPQNPQLTGEVDRYKLSDILK